MSFAITHTHEFRASHKLQLYDGTWEPLHPHDWRVKVTVKSEKLDSIGVVMDFHELDRLLEEIIAPWRGGSFNDLPAFATENPSAENVALLIARRLNLPQNLTLAEVEVWETAENSAVYSPPN